MTEYVNYKTAPIGTVASKEFTTLVRNDKGWYYLEGKCQEGDGHMVPRYEIHRFELGEVITPETLAWLPPGSVIAPKREDHAMVRNDDGGWGWADGIPGVTPDYLAAYWVANGIYTLTMFPGLEENPYAVGKTLAGKEAYENAPVGTLVTFDNCATTERVKLANGEWRRLNDPLTVVAPNSLDMERTITGFLALWEVDLLTTPPEVDPRVEGTVRLDYTYNAEKGTVYATNPHRDFGHVVELPNGRFLAVPNRAPRDFETAQEAVEWLI